MVPQAPMGSVPAAPWIPAYAGMTIVCGNGEQEHDARRAE